MRLHQRVAIEQLANEAAEAAGGRISNRAAAAQAVRDQHGRTSVRPGQLKKMIKPGVFTGAERRSDAAARFDTPQEPGQEVMSSAQLAGEMPEPGKPSTPWLKWLAIAVGAFLLFKMFSGRKRQR